MEKFAFRKIMDENCHFIIRFSKGASFDCPPRGLTYSELIALTEHNLETFTMYDEFSEGEVSGDWVQLQRAIKTLEAESAYCSDFGSFYDFRKDWSEFHDLLHTYLSKSPGNNFSEIDSGFIRTFVVDIRDPCTLDKEFPRIEQFFEFLVVRLPSSGGQ